MSYSITDICHFCNSDNLTSQTNLSGMHWGSLHCADCGKHLQWLPNPSVTAEFEERKQLIDKALESGRVTAWENLFLRSIRESRTLSPKRQQKFEQICQRHAMKIPACGGAGSG